MCAVRSIETRRRTASSQVKSVRVTASQAKASKNEWERARGREKSQGPAIVSYRTVPYRIVSYREGEGREGKGREMREGAHAQRSPCLAHRELRATSQASRRLACRVEYWVLGFGCWVLVIFQGVGLSGVVGGSCQGCQGCYSRLLSLRPKKNNPRGELTRRPRAGGGGGSKFQRRVKKKKKSDE